jgi:hypothetical protein
MIQYSKSKKKVKENKRVKGYKNSVISIVLKY